MLRQEISTGLYENTRKDFTDCRFEHVIAAACRKYLGTMTQFAFQQLLVIFSLQTRYPTRVFPTLLFGFFVVGLYSCSTTA